MQITDIVSHERNVGVCLLNVKTENCKTRVNIAEFQFILFSYSWSLSTSPLDFADSINCNFNYFHESHSLSTHSHSEKSKYISVNIALSHILTIQIKFKKSITKDFECCQYFKISKYLSLIKASEKTISLNIFQFDSKSECCHDGEIISGKK